VIFFDTNVLVYYTVNQDEVKQKLSKELIEEAIRDGHFFISPLVMTEYIFILSKLKIREENSDKIYFFSKFIRAVISEKEIMEAYHLCEQIDFCKNINDTIHFVVAQKYCNNLVTFDNDFKKLQNISNLKITVL